MNEDEREHWVDLTDDATPPPSRELRGPAVSPEATDPPRDEPPAGDPELPPEERARQRRIWLIVALVGAVLAGILLASSVFSGYWDEEPASERAAVDNWLIAPEKQCAVQSTYDALKREIFRRAAQARGSDQHAYAKLADFALLRVQSPVLRGVDEDLRRINCNGTAVLQLPPGVMLSDGGRTITADLDYAVQPSADGTGNVVLLGNADAMTVPLATLQRMGGASNTPLLPPQLEPVTIEDLPPLPEMAPSPPPQPSEPPPQPRPQPDPPQSSANPSFNCNNARTRGEIAVCNDSGLAALDRQMAAQFNSAMNHADPRQRALLRSTRSRFLNFRDNCRNDRCVADTYRGRMREIRDIMNNNWQPPR